MPYSAKTAFCTRSLRSLVDNTVLNLSIHKTSERLFCMILRDIAFGSVCWEPLEDLRYFFYRGFGQGFYFVELRQFSIAYKSYGRAFASHPGLSPHPTLKSQNTLSDPHTFHQAKA